MNIKIKKLTFVLFSFLFAIYLVTVLIKGIETNKSDITNMNILNYIPKDYEITILSNSTNNNIKRYLNENISDKRRSELNIIKDSIISYLGFNLKEKFENIYDNEFALTFYENKLNKSDILLIFKLKKNKDINHIINIGDELNKSDQIIELKRLGKLNYISHLLRTKDNYLIASSNKKLIYRSLQSDNNEILPKNLIPENIKLKEIKLLSISKCINPKNNFNSEPQQFNNLITIINSENNKLKLRSFFPNINKSNTRIINNQIDNIKDIIFTSKYSTYKQNINFLYDNINQKEFIDEISQELNQELLFISNDNNWVLCIKNKLPNKISVDQFNILKKYKKEDLIFNNINYSIYTNDKLKIKDNNIIYEKENPIFSVKDEANTYISNNFDDLINITKNATLFKEYLNYNDNIEYKYILNDIYFINYIDNAHLVKYFKPLKNLQYFFNTELFSLENINISISHIVPESYETLLLESNLEIL